MTDIKDSLLRQSQETKWTLDPYRLDILLNERERISGRVSWGKEEKVLAK